MNKIKYTLLVKIITSKFQNYFPPEINVLKYKQISDKSTVQSLKRVTEVQQTNFY